MKNLLTLVLFAFAVSIIFNACDNDFDLKEGLDINEAGKKAEFSQLNANHDFDRYELASEFLFERKKGTPVLKTESFPLSSEDTILIKIINGPDDYKKSSSASVELNGTALVSVDDFNQQVSELEFAVIGQLNNTIAAKLQSAPNSAIKVQVFKRKAGPGLSSVAAYSTRKVLVQDYSGELFQADDNDRLLKWFDQNQDIDISIQARNNLTVDQEGVIFNLESSNRIAISNFTANETKYSGFCRFMVTQKISDLEYGVVPLNLYNQSSSETMNIAVRIHNDKIQFWINLTAPIFEFPLAYNSWYTAGISFDYDAGKAFFYLNGEYLGEASLTSTAYPDRLYIGGTTGNSRYSFKESDLIFYDQLIDQVEALSIHNYLSE